MEYVIAEIPDELIGFVDGRRSREFIAKEIKLAMDDAIQECDAQIATLKQRLLQLQREMVRYGVEPKEGFE